MIVFNGAALRSKKAAIFTSGIAANDWRAVSANGIASPKPSDRKDKDKLMQGFT